MTRKLLALLAAVLFIWLLSSPQVASAHQTITIGNYAVEYGWLNEPAVVGQPNAVVINISDKNAANTASPAKIDISNLDVEAVYGGQIKDLDIQPLGENSPGQYIAPMTPTRPGTYTIHLGGTLDNVNVNTDVQPEEVQTADLVQFPLASAASSTPASGSLNLVEIAALMFGVAGTVLGALALIRKPARIS